MEHGVEKPKARYSELDSLRGVAALTVVFHHFRLMYVDGKEVSSWTLRLLHPFTAGHEAVMLFFLLSGFVLSVPYLRGRGQEYPFYLLRRVLRIYGPYLAALALAVAGAAKWHGPLGEGPWANETWSAPVSKRLVLHYVVMIGNYDWPQYNTAFWSLVAEMRISIVFPFLLLLVRRISTGTAFGLAIGLMAGTSLAAHHWPNEVPTLSTVGYAGIFVWGILLATHVERVNEWFAARSRAQKLLFAACSFALYSWSAHFHWTSRFIWGVADVPITAGAAGYMLLAMGAQPVRRALNSAVAAFLGRISYSLYLVHGTVLFALAHAVGRRRGLPLLFTIYVSASLLLAYLFCLAVEEPFLRLSRRAGKLGGAGQRVLGAGVQTAGPA